MNKYRGKRIDNGEWVYGYLIGDDVIVGEIVEWDDDYFCTEFWVKVDPDSVGQYTGLPDRNGKEIYDNAVVLITGEQELDYGYTFRWNEKAIVKWDDVECGFYLDVINKREVKLCEDGCFTVDRFPLRKWTEEEWWIEYEVIHEHYSLLKGDSKDA